LDTRELEAAEAQGLADNKIRDSLSVEKAAAYNFLCTVITTVAEILVQPSTTPFNGLLKDWNERLAKRTRSTLDASLTFEFFREHSQYIDLVDAYIIGSSCASQLVLVLREQQGIQDHLERANLAFGPGCAILTYHLLANRLGLGAGETYVLADQGHLYRPLSDHELAWKAMRERVSLGVKGHTEFERTHRIPDATIKLPGVQVSFVSDAKVNTTFSSLFDCLLPKIRSPLMEILHAMLMNSMRTLCRLKGLPSLSPKPVKRRNVMMYYKVTTI
jgi:hypothetical protein